MRTANKLVTMVAACARDRSFTDPHGKHVPQWIKTDIISGSLAASRDSIPEHGGISAYSLRPRKLINKMAERQGFEPWVPVKAHRFSKPTRSTTPASLRWLNIISKN